MTIPEEDGIWSGVDELDYHADLTSLSSTGARTLLASPRKFRWQQDNGGRPNAKHFDTGHYVHSLVLGVGMDVEIIDAENYTTKFAREQRDKAYAAGRIPMLRNDALEAEEMARQIRNHPDAAALLNRSDGYPELSCYWHDEPTGVRLRARIDWLLPYAAVDVKTAASADPSDWGSAAAKWKLHFQAAWYLEGLRALGIEIGSRFFFLNVEKEPPYEVSVTRLPDRALALGARQVRKAIDLYATCQESGVWPGYPPGIHTVDLPQWLYYQEEA